MERKIGEIFEDNGTFLKVVKSIKKGCCTGCYYSDKALCHHIHADVYQGECTEDNRTDNTGVIFKEIKTMTKSDLKPGMLVECSDGDRFIVLSDTILANENYFMSSEGIKDDLTCPTNNDATIHKVFTLNNLKTTTLHNLLEFYDFSETDLIWERPKEVVLTMEQIAEKFNVDVNQLKIKK